MITLTLRLYVTTMGMIYEDLYENKEKAIEFYQKCLNADPSLSTTHAFWAIRWMIDLVRNDKARRQALAERVLRDEAQNGWFQMLSLKLSKTGVDIAQGRGSRLEGDAGAVSVVLELLRTVRLVISFGRAGVNKNLTCFFRTASFTIFTSQPI